MVTTLDIAAEVSDLFEAADYEGTMVSEFFDTEILPLLKTPLRESDFLGIGNRFANAIDKVRMSLNQQKGDRFRRLMDMMKSALLTYVRSTHDAVTGREVWHRGLHSHNSDLMMTITAAACLANALMKQSPDQAQNFLRGIAKKLSGAQKKAPAMIENSSGAAVSAGSVAAFAMGSKKKKMRRPDSIFAEDMSWLDIQEFPDAISTMQQIVQENQNKHYAGVLVDPATAELVLAVHSSLRPEKRIVYEGKPINEMIGIAFRAVQRGLIQVVMEENEV